jgi:nitrite reductase (NADH) large subunit
MSEPLVIVGNGVAAARLCEELAQRALGRYAVAVIGEEPLRQRDDPNEPRLDFET